MFFKYLFDIAKPPVRDAPGAFFASGDQRWNRWERGRKGVEALLPFYPFTFLLFYIFTFLPLKAFLPLKTRGLSFFTFLPFYFFTFFRNFAPKS